MPKLHDQFEEYLKRLQIEDGDWESYKQDLEDVSNNESSSSSLMLDGSESCLRSSGSMVRSPLPTPSRSTPLRQKRKLRVRGADIAAATAECPLPVRRGDEPTSSSATIPVNSKTNTKTVGQGVVPLVAAPASKFSLRKGSYAHQIKSIVLDDEERQTLS